MTHLLAHVLQRMSQVSATSALALPVLEFLSGLIPIPSLYSRFMDRDYLSVFAIALLYTDPHR
jgi:tuberous sclerosis protein 2